MAWNLKPKSSEILLQLDKGPVFVALLPENGISNLSLHVIRSKSVCNELSDARKTSCLRQVLTNGCSSVLNMVVMVVIAETCVAVIH